MRQNIYGYLDGTNHRRRWHMSWPKYPRTMEAVRAWADFANITDVICHANDLRMLGFINIRVTIKGSR